MLTIAEIISRVGTIHTRTQDLREQWDTDYSLIQLDPYKIDKSLGEFTEFTGNGPGVLADSYERTLSKGILKLSVAPLAGQNEASDRESKTRTLTEQLVYGALWAANQSLLSFPSGVDLQTSWGNDAVECGGTITLAYLIEELVGGEWKLRPQIQSMSPPNSYWIEGGAGVLWFCNIRYGSKEEIADYYGNDKLKEDPNLTKDSLLSALKEDSYGNVGVWRVWDNEKWRTFSGDTILDEDDHELGYVPVYIRPVGGKNRRQISHLNTTNKVGNNDTLKYTWRSAIALNRTLSTHHNYLLTLLMTQAGLQVKPVTIFDSLDGKFIPPAEDLNVPGARLPTKKSNEETIKQVSLATPVSQVIEMLQFVDQQISLGGTAPDYIKLVSTAQTSSGMAQFLEASRQSLNPYAQNIEYQGQWVAEQTVKQYKNGEFEATHIEGIEPGGKRFAIDLQPELINENEHFVAELKLNLMRDKMSEALLLKTLQEIGATSHRYILETTHEDPDLIQQQQDEDTMSPVLKEAAWRLLQDAITDKKGRPNLAKAKENEWIVHRLQEVLGLDEANNPSLPGAPPAPSLGLPSPESVTGAGVMPRPSDVAAMPPMTPEQRMTKLGLTLARR